MHEPRARHPPTSHGGKEELLQDQAYMRETLLLTAGQVKERGEGEIAQKEGQKDKTDTCIMYGNTLVICNM